MRILTARHKAEFAVLCLSWRQVSQGGRLKFDDTVLRLLAVQVLTLDVTSSKSFKSYHLDSYARNELVKTSFHEL